MNPPVVLSVRIKNDAQGPQTGDVVLDNSTIQSWAPGKTYDTGDVFVYDGQFYQATEHFVAGQTFNTDHCVQIGVPDLVLSGFQPNTYYQQGELITESGLLYMATEDFISGSTFNRNDWTKISGGEYNFVSGDGTVQISLQDHGGTVSFSIANTLNAAVRSLEDEIATKVDKVAGKGLSTNDYTDAAKSKLDNLANIKQIGTGLTLTSTGRLDANPDPVTYDDFLSTTSENAVQNKVITASVNGLQSSVDALTQGVSSLGTRTTDLESSVSTLQTTTAGLEGDITYLQTEIETKVDKEVGKGLSSNDYTDTDANKLQSLAEITAIGAGLSLDNGTLTAEEPEVILYNTTGENTDGAMTQKATTEALELKANTADLAAVATSGLYVDLEGKPTIPSKTSDLVNDTNFVSDANYVHTDYNFSANYISIINEYNSKELTTSYDASTQTATLNWTPKQQ